MEKVDLTPASIVKNAVIVPVGSKGGFVVRRLAQYANEERSAEVRSCYQTFIRGMLDLTDNRSHESVIAPSRVVRYDQDDPYLVVAADKGTATFSDLANEVATEYGYWLDDAFASGGGAGYDHKAMGITARGAWESVKRLFRELDINTQTQPFSVVGIGDMSGDVFGNGLLLSRQIRLIGAFNHLHIFIDPPTLTQRSPLRNVSVYSKYPDRTGPITIRKSSRKAAAYGPAMSNRSNYPRLREKRLESAPKH